ncbi:MAG TPA: heavy metal-binding domain-containing protein [Candidatus Xenobia bacterium]|jgi:uncharacterized protein YbjQ (UPF0145 family)
MPVITGLSGNEIFCLQLKGMIPGELVMGNSVYSMGFLGSIGSSFRSIVGGEVKAVTDMVHQGRQLSFQRLMEDAGRHGADGITGVTSELVAHPQNVEFLSVGSAVHETEGAQGRIHFSTASNAQDLYCAIDAGFLPTRFVFGNVCYTIGVGGGMLASLKALGRGEIPEYTRMFNDTRRLALDRMVEEARLAGANAVVGIKTSIVPFKQGLMQEMVMVGTACQHPALPHNVCASSDLTGPELWNMCHLGIAPLRLVLGASVYSLGMIGGFMAAMRGLRRGEITELTALVYEARERALQTLAKEAQACAADDVAGIKVYFYELPNNLIEVLAIGTAVKRTAGVSTSSEQLPIQAVMDDKDTFFNAAEREMGSSLNRPTSLKNQASAGKNVKRGLDVLTIILKLLGG